MNLLNLIAASIAFPAIVAFFLLFVRGDRLRAVVVYASAAIIAILAVALIVMRVGSSSLYFVINAGISSTVGWVCLAISILCALVIIGFSIRYRRILPCVLALVQIGIVLFVELAYGHDLRVDAGLYVDNFSLLMTFIIGIIGSGICVYALGYMKDFQSHEPEGSKDRRPLFFALMFLFLAAMFGIIFSNNMLWLLCCWEVTTLCSFLLIGYTRTEEAIRNSFRQINMNLLGGIAFACALLYCGAGGYTFSLLEFIQLASSYPATFSAPVILLSIAGMTKAAQMPFQSWLLGAMVAPTPTSALLHSSTMVKAGVFLLVKLAPCYLAGVVPSVLVMLVGTVTFLLCSFMAISQSNAKRVLAYSTVANLGLVTACAGIATPEAVWAALFLILFHAIAKSLLFLCVGTAEHHIGSRNIEDMDLLFDRMPRLARFMMLGIMCMFIAPFGMLMSKWATLVSFIDTDQVALIIMLAFGSAATFMFWAKWLGKLSGIAASQENIEKTVHRSEWISLMTMVVLLVVACLAFPIVSNGLVEPYTAQLYGDAGQGIADDNLIIASLCTVAVVLVMFVGLGKSKSRKADVYLAGVSVDNDSRAFRNSMSGTSEALSRNWYMESTFREEDIGIVGESFCSIIMILAVAYAVLVIFGIVLI